MTIPACVPAESAELMHDLAYREHMPSDEEDEARDRARDEGRFDEQYQRPEYEGLMCEAIDRISEAVLVINQLGVCK